MLLGVVYTSPEHSLKSEEKLRLKKILASFQAKEADFFESIEEDLGEELAMQLILIK